MTLAVGTVLTGLGVGLNSSVGKVFRVAPQVALPAWSKSTAGAEAEAGQQLGGQRAVEAFAQARKQIVERFAARTHAEVGQLLRDQARLRRHGFAGVAIFETGVHRVAEGAATQRRQAEQRRMRRLFGRGGRHGQRRFALVGRGAVFRAADPGAADQR